MPSRSRQVVLMLNASLDKKKTPLTVVFFERQYIKGAHTKDKRSSVISLQDGLFFVVTGIIIVCLFFSQSAANGDTSNHARRGQQAALDAER
jgi:hypothetical protein